MGAWSAESFHNDDARDWVADLERNGLSAVISAFGPISEEADYLEAPDCSNAIAAAEVVAALRGKPAKNLPQNVTAWVAGKPAPNDALVAKARAALELILTKSELRELWEESSEYGHWRASVADLENRLF